jgi:hypothetical protein
VGQRERGRGGARSARLAIGPGAAHAGKGEKRGMGCQGEKGPAQGEGEKRAGRAAGLGCLLFFPLLSFFFSILKPFKQTYLNPNKFEFKPYKLNTRKLMLQHECTNMLTL